MHFKVTLSCGTIGDRLSYFSCRRRVAPGLGCIPITLPITFTAVRTLVGTMSTAVTSLLFNILLVHLATNSLPFHLYPERSALRGLCFTGLLLDLGHPTGGLYLRIQDSGIWNEIECSARFVLLL